MKRQEFDAVYLERLRGGDPETEAHFSAYFGELILIKLRARHYALPLIQEVRQETFVRVLKCVRSPEGLRIPEALGAYVNTTCNNVAHELCRMEARHDPPANGSVDPPAPDPDPEAQLISKERKQLVWRVIKKLSARERQLLCALLEERDKDEMCAQFGVNRDHLRLLLHRARAKFRTLYVARQQPSQGAAAFLRDPRRSRRSMGG